MRIENNATTVSETEHTHRNRRTGELEQNKKNSVYAGNLNLNMGGLDTSKAIEKRREQAQKEAMKVIQTAFDGEKQTDDLVAANRANVNKARQKNDEITQQMKPYIDRKEELLKGDSGIDEQELKDIDETISAYQDQITQNNNEIEGNLGAVRAISQERLKSHPMVDAKKQADQINAAASDEIIGMIVSEAKDHIEEEQQKTQEEAKEKAEKKEEQEEQIEAIRQKKEQLENTSKGNDNSQQNDVALMPVDKLTDLSTTADKAQDEVKNIINKMKILSSDIKGAAIDENV